MKNLALLLENKETNKNSNTQTQSKEYNFFLFKQESHALSRIPRPIDCYLFFFSTFLPEQKKTNKQNKHKQTFKQTSARERIKIKQTKE